MIFLLTLREMLERLLDMLARALVTEPFDDNAAAFYEHEGFTRASDNDALWYWLR